MFQLNQDEAESLRSQIVTLKKGTRGAHRKYRPYAFTEQGVAMLSSVLRSPRAVQVNILSAPGTNRTCDLRFRKAKPT